MLNDPEGGRGCHLLESRRALPERTELRRLIRRSSNKLAVQSRDMLTLARAQSGRVELRPDVFEACEMVQKPVDELRPTASGKGLRLAAQTPILVGWMGSCEPCVSLDS